MKIEILESECDGLNCVGCTKIIVRVWLIIWMKPAEDFPFNVDFKSSSAGFIYFFSCPNPM